MLRTYVCVAFTMYPVFRSSASMVMLGAYLLVHSHVFTSP